MTPLVNDIGTIPAESSVTVPVIIQRLSTSTPYDPVSFGTEQAFDLQAPSTSNAPPFVNGSTAAYFFNANGAKEKYLVSANGSNPAGGGYYFILPNGNLYAWDGNSLATSEAVGSIITLSPAVYTDPTQLINDPQPTGSSSPCGAAFVSWTAICDNNTLGYTSSIAYINFGCPGVPGGYPVMASNTPTGVSGNNGEGSNGPGGPGGVSFSPGSQSGVSSLNLCDPKDAAKLANATLDAALAVGGAIPGIGTIFSVISLVKDTVSIVGKVAKGTADLGDLGTLVLDTVGLIPVAGTAAKAVQGAVGIYGAARSVNGDLSDPPQNFPPSLQDALLQLSTEADRLEDVTNLFTDFFGSSDWMAQTDTADFATEAAWVQAFFQDAVDANGNSQLISSAEQTQLLALPLPSNLTMADAVNFIARWNNTLNYNAAGVFNMADVPAGQSTNFIPLDVFQADLLVAQNALAAMQNEGYTGLYDGVQAAINAAIDAFEQANDTGICAAVQLQINQQATVVRSAFQASFTLDNQKPADTLQNISVTLAVHSMSGTDDTSLFFISAPTLSGLTAIDGTGTLAPDSTGTAGWTIVPTDAAAADGITSYLVEGTLSYVDNGYDVNIPILPTTITVYPGPNLQVQYFLQQNVYGDDPFSPTVTTPQPFALGLLVTNTGAGNAGDFTITSSQPQIIDNKKGLLINFNITGAQVGNQPITPSLTADLGTIASGQTVVADWQMTSSLDGTFSNMSATYQHTDALGGTATSIISSVTIHDMIHMVQPNEPGDNGDPAFLVDSDPTASDLPDTLYLADGTTAPVNIASNAAVDGTVSMDNLDVQLTATMTSGWDFIQLPDPGVGFTLAKVVSSDGTQILVGPNAWTTHPVDAGTNDPAADLFQLLDFNGTGSYTLYYLPIGAQPPAVVSLAAVSPNPTSGPISSIDVTLSEQVSASTFNPSQVSLTLNGGPNLINSGVTFTQVAGATYQIGGLAPLTAANGVYQLTVLPGLVQDSAGELSTGTLSENWANGDVGPYVVQVDSVSPNPRNTPVDSVDVEFDEAINPSTFGDGALSLTLNGGTNLIDSAVTVAQVSDTTYEISGLASLTTTDGATC